MPELVRTQKCPYCNYEVDDCNAVWEESAEEEVECDSCGKAYVVKPQYVFKGFLIEKQCEKCEEWTEDGYVLCDCSDGSY